MPLPKRMHSTRVSDRVWDAAKSRADAEDRTMAEVIESLLARFGRGVGK